jgi:hypothetical protein
MCRATIPSGQLSRRIAGLPRGAFEGLGMKPDALHRARGKTSCFGLLEKLLSEACERQSKGFRPPKLRP